MKFFLDTASLKDINWATQAGLIDGITTNPSLLAKQAGDLDPRDVLKEICSLVEGPVSAEVVAVDTEGMVTEGTSLAKIADNIVVKIPMLEDGMVAVRRLTAAGIRTNVTLCFSSPQCLIAAKAGATYVSPVIGRLDDVGQEGMGGIRGARGSFDNHSIQTQIPAGSLRHPRPGDALVQARAHLDDVDLDRAAEHEKRLRHDVMAHILALGDQAPAARPYLHLGATSAYVTDNADLLLMREALQLLLGRLAAVLVPLGKPARKNRALPSPPHTHFQAAQRTTVGQRFTPCKPASSR